MCICQTVWGGVVFVTSKIAAFTAGGGVEAHSSNSTLPFCKSRAEPAKKEKTGASLSTHTISAGFSVVLPRPMGYGVLRWAKVGAPKTKRARCGGVWVALS